MPMFSGLSLKNLSTCDSKLQSLFLRVIDHYDCTVICGYRGEKETDEAFRNGFSKVQWPNSKHNTTPSLAVDVAPYPVKWTDTIGFYHFAGFVRATAISLDIPIRCGADWDGDYNLHDQGFMDLAHYELL